MGWLQRFIEKNLGRDIAAEMREESQNWHIECPKCGNSNPSGKLAEYGIKPPAAKAFWADVRDAAASCGS